MKKLYDVPVCNFLGQRDQWLRTIRQMEEEDVYDPPITIAPLSVLAAIAHAEMDEAAKALKPIHGAPATQVVAETDADTESLRPVERLDAQALLEKWGAVIDLTKRQAE